MPVHCTCISTWSSRWQVRVRVQILTLQVQVRVQLLWICTRVQLEYMYKYQVLHLCFLAFQSQTHCLNVFSLERHTVQGVRK